MGKVELDIGIDPELLAQAKRLGISVGGMSETQLRLHLQRSTPPAAKNARGGGPRRTPRRSRITMNGSLAGA